MTQYFLKVSRYKKVVWLTVDESIDGTVMPVLDYIEWPTQKKPWQSLLTKLEQECPWIPPETVASLISEARAILLYLMLNPLSSVSKVKELEESFPNTKFRGNWVTPQ